MAGRVLEQALGFISFNTNSLVKNYVSQGVKKEIEIALITKTNWGNTTIIIQRKFSLRRVTWRIFLRKQSSRDNTSEMLLFYSI